jgi:hypothetical protein
LSLFEADKADPALCGLAFGMDRDELARSARSGAYRRGANSAKEKCGKDDSNV